MVQISNTQALNVGILTYGAWDPRKSLDFLTNVLGLYPQLRGDLETSFHLLVDGIDTRMRPDKIFIGCSETLVEFTHPAPDAETTPQDPDTYAFGVVVNNFDEMVVDVEFHGGKIVKSIKDGESFWGRQVVIDVPGGPQILLLEYRAPEGHSEEGQTVDAKALNIGVVPYRPWNPDACLEFLTDALGFYRRPSEKTTFVGCGDTLLQFYDAAPGADMIDRGFSWAFGVVVNNLEDTLAVVERHGARIARPIWNGYSFWGRQVVVTVPGGPQISLRQYREPDGPHFDGWYEEKASS